MHYKLYTNSGHTWDAMIESIEQAEKSIYLEMYIFLDDTSESHDFVGKLKQKAKEGIRVIVVVDVFGSYELKKETVKAIRESGVEFLFFSKWLRHIHRKVLIIDEKIAFVGGVNIAKHFKHWNDMHLKIQGRMVKTFLKSFAYTYAMAGGKTKKILDYRKRTLKARFRFWLVEHSPFHNIHSLKDQYREKISNAKNKIQIITPYLVPPRWLIALLDNAIRRGVKVEVILPKNTDIQFVNRINYHYMKEMSALGIDFFLTKPMTHAKVLVIDGEEALIGTQNVVFMSFSMNYEVGIFFKEKNLVKEVQEIIDKWEKESSKFHAKKFKMKTFDYVVLVVMKMLRPIL